MVLHFLKRELNKDKIEWGITPYYLMAIRGSHPKVWSNFVRVINSIDDRSLDRALDKKKKSKGG